MEKYTYEHFEFLQNSIAQTYLLDQVSLKNILLGHCSAKNPFRREVTWKAEKHKKELDRIEEYLENPFSLLDDMYRYLYGDEDPSAQSQSLDSEKTSKERSRDGKPKPGFLPDFQQTLIRKIESCTDGSPKEDLQLEKLKKKWKADVRRVYYWFQPCEKNGAIVKKSKRNVDDSNLDDLTGRFPYERILKAAEAYLYKRFKALSSLCNEMEQLLAEKKDAELPASGLHLFLEEYQELLNDIKKFEFYLLYGFSPEIVTTIWQYRGEFASFFSNKLLQYYHWNQADSSSPAISKRGKQYIENLGKSLEGVRERLQKLPAPL